MSSPLEAGRPTPETLKAFANLLTLKDDFFKRVQRVQPMVQQWDLTADEIALFSRGGLTSLATHVKVSGWKYGKITESPLIHPRLSLLFSIRIPKRLIL